MNEPIDNYLPELHNVETTTPQAHVNAEAYRFIVARNERLFEALLMAQMWLAVHDEKRAMQVLSQALTS